MEFGLVRRAILFGAALGLITRYGSQLPGDFDWLQRVGVPWLAVAFAAAVGVPRVRQGAALGAISLVAAILVYYAALAFLQNAYDRSPLGVAWLLVAIPGGALFGTLGSLWSGSGHWRWQCRSLPRPWSARGSSSSRRPTSVHSPPRGCWPTTSDLSRTSAFSFPSGWARSDDRRGMSRCRASAIPADGVRRGQTPGRCRRIADSGH